ncbi:MAG: hypothetical protein H6717_26960 [Polyangiaceae bacterium]|nr:hypothetical protein [Polyangiaceae bacterium]
MVQKAMTVALLLAVATSAACGSDDAAGSGGAAGTATGGQAGVSGSGGTGGGGAGAGGSAGTGGAAGSGGSAGSPSTCGTVSTFADGKTPSKELHVDAAASSGGDGSAQSPFQTLSAALGQTSPGTSVVIHPGTYAGGTFISDLAGTESAPIWIGGVAGQPLPVIDGGTEGLHLSKVRYLVVHDLEVRNATGNGINCDDGGETSNPDATRFVVFDGLDIHDIGTGGNEDCLKLSGLDDYFVLNGHFARCGGSGSGSGIDHVGCHDGVIFHSSFEQNSGNAVQAKGGSENILLWRNHVKDGGERAFNMGGSTGPQFFRPPLSTTGDNYEAKNIRAEANVIEGSVAAIAFVGCVDCAAINNTIVDPEHWVLRILQETTSSGAATFLEAQNGVFANNLVYFDSSALATFANVGPNTQGGSFTFMNNLWYAHDAPGSSAPTGLPATESGAVVGQDPGLTADFHISAASPAAGAGTPQSGAHGDFDGSCWRSPPAIGALEAP